MKAVFGKWFVDTVDFKSLEEVAFCGEGRE